MKSERRAVKEAGASAGNPGLASATEPIAGTKRRPQKRANSLDGRLWTRYSISIWSDVKKTREETSLRHPAMFPVELPKRLIQIFTAGEQALVLDPFAGIGSTMLAAQALGRRAIGFEVSAEYCEVARERLRQGELFASRSGDCVVYNEDVRNLRNVIADDSVDLVITSPPYWDILSQKRTADYKPTREYAAGEADLSKIADYTGFLDALKGIFADVKAAMRPGSYCCVVVMDLRKKDRFYPFHMDIANFMRELGFVFDDIVIWDRRHEYNNMRPLGYPFVFRVNKAHEYILLFVKPSAGARCESPNVARTTITPGPASSAGADEL